MEASFILCNDSSVVVEPVCSFSKQFARDSLGGDVSERRQTRRHKTVYHRNHIREFNIANLQYYKQYNNKCTVSNVLASVGMFQFQIIL